MAGDKKDPTPEEQAKASAKEATEAAKALKLIKVTSTQKLGIPSPHAGWSLAEGANHFEGEIPKPVVERYAELVEQGVITVEVMGADGKAKPLELKPATVETPAPNPS